MIELLASPFKTLSKRSILIQSEKDFLRWTLSLKFWMNSGQFNGLPPNGVKSMGGKCLVSSSCCKAAATVMFSLVTALSVVSSPSINKSMKLSIGWKWGLLKFRKVLLFSRKLSCRRFLETVFELVGIYGMFSVLSFKSTLSELGVDEKRLGYGDGVKSTLLLVWCISSSSKNLCYGLTFHFLDILSNSKLSYALYSLNCSANYANWSLFSASTNFCCSFSSLRSFSFSSNSDLMFKFGFACETISFALAFSNWMFSELDLEFDEGGFEELLLDLEDLEDFLENISQYDWIFHTKSIIPEFSSK